MGRRRRSNLSVVEAVEFLKNIVAEKPLIPFFIPLVFILWFIERWIFPFSNWVLLFVAVWATVQEIERIQHQQYLLIVTHGYQNSNYGSYQRQILVDDLNKKWKQLALKTASTTPLEQCEWLNKLLLEVWPNFMNPKISIRFSSIVEKRIKHLNSKIIEKVELLEFSLGSSPPSVGLQGTQWAMSGDQRIMRLGFDWNTNDMSILLLAKLAKPLIGTARIIINSLHIKGDLVLMPVLDGKAILFSFITAPEVRIGVAFGSGGSQSLPATELPGVSSMLVKILTDTLVKTMVEPRRRCYSLAAVDLRKKAVGGIIYVTVISASKLSRSALKGSPSRRQQNGTTDRTVEEHTEDKDLQTFVEVELEELNRRTGVRKGSSPKWDSTFNMMLHDDAGTIRFHLYECTPNSVNYNYLASCEIKMKYVTDDSTTFWAIGPDSSAIAKSSQFCGKEVEMTIPFEGAHSGELTLRLVLKEWEFSDGSHSLNSNGSSRHLLYGSSNLTSGTGRKINITVVEGKNLTSKNKTGKYDPYVKLQYGKALQRTRTVQEASNPIWNQKFEFDEIAGGDYLRLKCFSEDTFGNDSLGSARVNLEGVVEGITRDVWVPLEKVNSGELRLQIEVARTDDFEGSRGSCSSSGLGNGWIELVLVEARDLIAADFRGTSDPYVRVHYGNLKRRTKVMYKTLTPRWNQTLEFPDDGSPLELHLKDHNALLPTSNIGDCVVEYQRLAPNEMSDKWIPLQGVKRGEIHVQITRKFPKLQEKLSLNAETSSAKAHQISRQMKQMMIKLQSIVEDGNSEGISTALSELESLEDTQEEYMLKLETEQMLLLNKIKELGEEFSKSLPAHITRIHSTI